MGHGSSTFSLDGDMTIQPPRLGTDHEKQARGAAPLEVRSSVARSINAVEVVGGKDHCCKGQRKVAVHSQYCHTIKARAAW